MTVGHGTAFGLGIVFLLSLISIGSAQLKVPYSELYLDHLFGGPAERVLTLSCQSNSTTRAGTIKLRSYPHDGFHARLTIDTAPCDGSSDIHNDRCDTGYRLPIYSIYFNVRILDLAKGDKIEIFEEGDLVTTLEGGQFKARNPTSYAQVQTIFGRDPTLEFKFTKTSQHIHTVEPLALDYNVVQYAAPECEIDSDELTGGFKIRCPALKGSVTDRLFCDDDEDRVNCPAEYSSGLPVLEKESAQFGRFCPAIISETTDAPAEPVTDDETTDDSLVIESTWSWKYPTPAAPGSHHSHHRYGHSLSTTALICIISGSVLSLGLLMFVIIRICCTAGRPRVIRYKSHKDEVVPQHVMAANYAAHGKMQVLGVPSNLPTAVPSLYTAGQLEKEQSMA